MIDHLSIGVRDLAVAKRFYDAALEPLGYRCLSEEDSSIGYGSEGIAFWLLASDSPIAENPGSGLHICFAAPDRASVDQFHSGAIGAGGRDNGAPGLRPDYGSDYYAAFVIDPEGYRLEAYCGHEAA